MNEQTNAEQIQLVKDDKYLKVYTNFLASLNLLLIRIEDFQSFLEDSSFNDFVPVHQIFY